MQGIIAKIIEMLIRYAVIPLFSQLIVSIVSYFQSRKEKADRDETIDRLVEDFKSAPTKEEKEHAFRNLVRSRNY